MKGEAVEPNGRPRVLLVGDACARPAGMERALTRAGFQLIEREDPAVDPEADAVLVTLKNIEEPQLGALLETALAGAEGLPYIVILPASDRDAAASAVALGASDALAVPVHLPELCARLHARIRERTMGPSGDSPTPELKVEKPGGLEALDSRVREEFERARRYSLSFSLILLGVDELRGVEERLGFEAAERLRQDVSTVLRKELRVPDFVVTYGATEFAIVLPETGQIGARQSVVRVRERLAVVPSEGDPRLDRPRFSAGIVTYPHPAVSQTDELYALAEAALMRGRSQAGERIGVAI